MSAADLFLLSDSETLFQLGLAIVLGAAVGVEREVRGRAAGLRTMIIVCLGSTLIMIVSSRFPDPFADDLKREIIRVDPGRVAAGIVTGVGFLGAGVILRLGDLVRGVTTAAGIWFVAGVGIAIGQKHYALATQATIACLGALWLLSYVNSFLPTHIYRTLAIAVDADKGTATLALTRALLPENKLRLMELKASEDRDAKTAGLELILRTRSRFNVQEFVHRVAQFEGVRHVRWW